MTANYNIIKKNIGTFVNAYGLAIDCEKVINWIRGNRGEIHNIGVLLYNPADKKPAICCHFPIDRDVSGSMIWVASDNRELQAIPIGSRSVDINNRQRPSLRLNENMTGEQFSTIKENDFTLQAHNSFKKQGVLERYNSFEGKGWIRRTHRGIFFRKEWCCGNTSFVDGANVSFLPIISRLGIQARAVDELQQ